MITLHLAKSGIEMLVRPQDILMTIKLIDGSSMICTKKSKYLVKESAAQIEKLTYLSQSSKKGRHQ